MDTHKDVRVAAVITSLGVPLDSKTFLSLRSAYGRCCLVYTFGVLRRANGLVLDD